MSELISIQKMATKCLGLIETTDINEWENGFLITVCAKVTVLKEDITEKQIEKLTQIYNKHFAG